MVWIVGRNGELRRVFVNDYEHSVRQNDGEDRARREGVGAFQRRVNRMASEGEGACLRILEMRYHQPLRGKLGWMTPRAGVKTTPALERAFWSS
jgi:hypothetical protein